MNNLPLESTRRSLALNTILQNETDGIPTWMIHAMEHRIIEHFADVPPGTYKTKPEQTYLQFQKNFGSCMIDQYIPDNPLTMGDSGYEEVQGVNAGVQDTVVDGLPINSGEDVAIHLERFGIPKLKNETESFDHEAYIQQIITKECTIQDSFGDDILKVPYGYVDFPTFQYGTYGYVPYFEAYLLFPKLIEQSFIQQSELAFMKNKALADAYIRKSLPPLLRLDHDMADSRGMLVNINSLDRIWFPPFQKSIQPLLDANIKLIWHCDGNLMDMIPRLLDVGLRGFQGFQYETGMDYEKICQMKTKNGEELIIIGGVSVTHTLPHGSPSEVKKEIDWLVQYGPKRGLFLGATSSITPGVPLENMKTLFEGFQYYQTHGRS
jgi:hypothetical protein